MILAYMENQDELDRLNIAGDLDCLCIKCLRTNVAQSYAMLARNDDGDRQKLEQIHGELTRGV
jgi:hypothetical protein